MNAPADTVLVKAFYEEAHLLKRLRHKNIVSFLGILVQSPDISIVTEYMSRGSLRKILHDTSILIEEEHIRRFALDVCNGMSFLHAQNVIHRDLKASNLLVDRDWTVKVADFGLSREGNESDHSLTMTACGTPAWAAPEVLQTQRYSAKADVYSFSICLWEMCTREVPYEGIPPYQIVISVATKGLRPVVEGKLAIPISDAIVEVMTTCWDEDPANRPKFSFLTEQFTTMKVSPAQHDTPCIRDEYLSASEFEKTNRRNWKS